MRFICKATHNHFIKDKEYTGIELSDGIATIVFITNAQPWYYTKEKLKGHDCINTWFWTLEEWREMRLKELGI
jgi:hypothetical protein